MINLLRYCLEDYVTLIDAALEKAVDQARHAGVEDAVCSLCPPKEIAGGLSEFLGWSMVRKVSAGQDLMRAAGTVTRRLGSWLYEHGYIDMNNAEVFRGESAERGRALPKTTALGNKLAAWVDNQRSLGSEKTYESHFEIIATRIGAGRSEPYWALSRVTSSCHRNSVTPSKLAGGSVG